MNVRIHPSRACGSVSAPPSKSMSHRALICAALAQGESCISEILACEDVSATLDCLRALGVECKIHNDKVIVKGSDLTRSQGVVLRCRESGSTMRFMLPLCLLSQKEITLIGAPSLMRRPMKVYQDICLEHGLFFSQNESGITVKGPLMPGEYTLPGDVSSQFISGMLFALTQVQGKSILRILPPFESRPYVLLTLQMLALFGADVKWLDDLSLCICGGKPMTAQDYTVEKDHSNAAFLSALGFLGGEVHVSGLSPASLQGDRIYPEHFQALKKGFGTISLADCPDLAPILFALAAAGEGGRFTDTRRLAIKESDRAEAMAQELCKLGVTVEIKENEIAVIPSALHAPTEPLFGHNDHRVIMALTVLATLTGGTVLGAEAVAKSFPDFFERISSLGIKVEGSIA